MSSRGGWVDSMTSGFPGRNPRPVLSWVFGLSSVIGILTGAFNIYFAFQLGAASGFIMLAIVVLSLSLGLGMLRILLDVAAAIFEMRDAIVEGSDGESKPGLWHETGVEDDHAPWMVAPRARVKSRDVEASVQTLGRHVDSVDVAQYLTQVDGATVEEVGDGLGSSVSTVAVVLDQLERDGAVLQSRDGVYMNVDPFSAHGHSTEVGNESDAKPEERRAGGDISPGPELASNRQDCGECGAACLTNQSFCSRCGSALS